MLIVLALAALVGSDDPDGVVTTAPRGAGAVMVGAETPTSDARPEAAQVTAVTPHNLTTRQQIDRWLSARTPESEPFAQAQGPGDDRRMHGFVSGAIGTQDYSAVAVGVSLPIGENGRLDLTYRETKNGWGYPGYGYDYPGEYGYGAYIRPYGVSDPFFGVNGRGRSRSVSLGFDWDQNRDRRERARTPVITAED